MSTCLFPNVVLLDIKDKPTKDSRLVRFLGAAKNQFESFYTSQAEGILSHESGFDASAELPVLVPCGKCVNCRANHAGEFAVRCYLEGLMTPEDRDNLFLTFTYDDDHVPTINLSDGKRYQNLVYDDVRNWIHDFRKEVDKLISDGLASPMSWVDDGGNERFGSGVRYMFCGEYGDQSSRPHYHMILFGVPKILLKESVPFSHRNGCAYYRNEFFENLWISHDDYEYFKSTPYIVRVGHQDDDAGIFSDYREIYMPEKRAREKSRLGNIIIGKAEFGSCFYTAGYALKKAYDFYDLPEGLRQPEPAYSTRPGLGYTYFTDVYLPEVKRRCAEGVFELPDILLPNGCYVPCPSYFIRKMELTIPEFYDKIKVYRYLNSFYEWSEKVCSENWRGFDYFSQTHQIASTANVPRNLL